MGDLNYGGKMDFSTHIIDLVFKPENWKCSNCHSSFTQNAIKPDVAEDLYASGEGSKRWSPKSFDEDKTRDTKKCLNKYLDINDIKILDVGSNTGEFLDYAKHDNVKTYGLELCEESCQILKSKGHIPFRSGKEINEKFDLITAFDVFEHIYEPNSFLEFMHSILNKDGHLIILTGNPESFPAKLAMQNWWYLNYPEHIIFPSPSFFESVKGFKVKETVKVFAAIAHEESGMLAGLKNVIKIIIGNNYSGRPAIIPDHQLVVLQRL